MTYFSNTPGNTFSFKKDGDGSGPLNFSLRIPQMSLDIRSSDGVLYDPPIFGARSKRIIVFFFPEMEAMADRLCATRPLYEKGVSLISKLDAKIYQNKVPLNLVQ